MKKPARRVRRSPEEARRLILETAQALLARTGPDGFRLQDIAAEAGISHPLILHYFKSRAALVRALTREAAAEFKDRLVGAMAQPEASTEELIDRVFDAFCRRVCAALGLASGNGPRRRGGRAGDHTARNRRHIAPAAGRRGPARHPSA